MTRAASLTSRDLEARIESRTAIVGVVGLGAVGLTSAVAFAEAGFEVVGVDVDARVAAEVAGGRLPRPGDEPELAELLARALDARRLTASTSHEALWRADAVLVCVPTPATREGGPDLAALTSAARSVGRTAPHGALVVIESTVAPGTMLGVVAPALAEGGAFLLGHAPERVMPGRLLANLRELPRACGAGDEAAARAMTTLYRAVVRAPIDVVDLVTSEIVKTAENAYRDVQIAFANEVARVCERAGADFAQVRELVNRSPGRAMLVAGAGVGGPCLPKDGRLLASATHPEWGALLRAARDVNDAAPGHVASLVEEALAEAGRALAGARVVLLGWGYLPGSGELRGSPTVEVARLLRERGAVVAGHDPYVDEHRGDLWSAARGADACALMTAHPAYAALDLARLRDVMRAPVLVDGRLVVDPRAAREAGLVFRGVGRGSEARARRRGARR